MRYDSRQYTSNNQNFVTPNVLELRLDTSQILGRIRQYLTGEADIIEKQGETILRKSISIGNPKANPQGVQSIINRINLILNPSYVQGNYTEQQYNREIAQIRRSLRDSLMINLHNWEIKIEDYEDIIDSIMSMVKGFASRLINNKERESYQDSIRHIETNTQQLSKGEKGV